MPGEKKNNYIDALLKAVESASEIIMITDREGKIQFVNPAFEEITGWKTAEVIEKTPAIIKSGSHSEAFYQKLWGTLNRGRVWRGTFINKKKSGELFITKSTISPILSEKGEIDGFVGVTLDVTGEKQLEQQFLQSQKLSEVGKMVSGIAHDFNNMLAVILTYSSFLCEEADKDSQFYQDLTEIKKAAERGAALTRQLLVFSRKEVLDMESFSLNAVIEDMLKMLRRTVGDHIQVKLDMSPETPSIYADRSQIEHAVMNLVMNAKDAMPGGGELIFKTGLAELDQGYADRHFGVTPGRYSVLEISDTGCGMDSETLQRAFDPFFTTKKRGEGTGLGLSTVYGIVKRLGGNVWAYSEKGLGTTFKLYFPIGGKAETKETVQRSAPKYKGQGQVILVVDDDPSVRKVVTRTLSSAGYSICSAGNAQKALELMETLPEVPELLISDVVMPGMNGRDLAQTIHDKHPKMKVIYISGYPQEVIQFHGILGVKESVLQKPFSKDALVEAVRRELNRP